MSEWIEHAGNDCPVRGDIEVEVKLKDGTINSGAAENYLWSKIDDMGDIKEYRIIKATKQDTPQPNWADAPEWANWWDVDADGNFYEIEPEMAGGIWTYSASATRNTKCDREGEKTWKESKVKRPDAKQEPATASNKPSWDDAPEDAIILIQSSSGYWNFGSYKSASIGDDDQWAGNGEGEWFKAIYGDAPNPNWRDTLERRPVKENKWIYHEGEKCPLEERVKIEVILKGGAHSIDFSDRFFWDLSKDGQIIKYRVIEYPTAKESLTTNQVRLSEDIPDSVPTDKYNLPVGSDYYPIRPKLEKYPSGLSPNTAGAKLDAGKVRPDLILTGMPRALLAVAEVGTFGANKYSENGWMAVPDGIKRYTAAMDRHRLKEGIEIKDSDSDLLHAAHLAWNALARLELILRD